MKKKKNIYEGIGFVELIISIGVASIALVVLMSIASNSMREAIRYERHDALTRLAMDGALSVRKHSENVNDLRRESLGFSVSAEFEPEAGECYRVDFENSEVDFSVEYSYIDLANEGALETKVIYNEVNDLGDVYYVAYCVDEAVSSGELIDLYSGKIVTGFVDCSNCNVEPYEHNIIISIKRPVEI